jgi:hypothetical protein
MGEILAPLLTEFNNGLYSKATKIDEEYPNLEYM